MTTTERLAEQVADESQALDLFNALRDRFNWSGTVFIRQDARDAVAERLSEVTGEYVSPDTGRHDVETLTDQLMDSYEYRKLEDRFAEEGNRLLADAAADLIPEKEG